MKKENILSTISDNLRYLMNKQDVSISELARRCDMSSGTITKIIAGSMSLSIITAMKIADGLDVDISQLFKGLINVDLEEMNIKEDAEITNIGILSLENKRATCILDSSHRVIGTSELSGGLDLAETSGKLIRDIQDAIESALYHSGKKEIDLKQSKLKLVMQSYEFENTRNKFIHFAERYFQEIIILSDWQLTYLSVFDKKPGISLIVDKGVSLSYQHEGSIKKIGGWKFPVYDLGGENWLGIETIKHTIRAFEGYCPKSELAKIVLSNFEGKIESIVETFFKGGLGADAPSTFTKYLFQAYFSNVPEAHEIMNRGLGFIKESIARIDEITGRKMDIAIQGSLANIYKENIEKERLINNLSTKDNIELLAKITKEELLSYGIYA
jgi:N-acetylglucosamine kinase-like BadF-type ATPase/plasmid maintenance system antidote protein VapI